MSKIIIDPQVKAQMLINTYRTHYEHVFKDRLLKGSNWVHQDADNDARKAAENLQIFIDGYIEDIAGKDMVVDQEHDFPDQEAPDGTT